MSEVMTRQENENDFNDKDVLAWLKKNPRFLQQHPEVLDHLLPPQEKTGKGIVDFQYYMVKRLQADRDGVLESTREIVETSRANMNNLARIHTAVLMLLESRDFEDFLRTITLDLAAILDVDIVTLVVEADGKSVPHINLSGVRIAQPGTIDAVMADKAVFLEENVAAYEEVFGGAATLVKSQALLRLTVMPETPPVMLAFGSRNPDMFQNGQATDLIGFLGKVVERKMRSWLGLL